MDVVADLPTLRRTVVSLAFTGRRRDATGQRATMESLGLAHPDRADYVPSPWWVLTWLLRRSDVAPTDALLELGCGKGRVVAQAAERFPFSRVIGIELAPGLAAAARALARERAGRFGATQVQIVEADATTYRVPDDITHVYLFNPFNGETFAAALAQILASLDRRPRPLTMVYVQPEELPAIMATGRFHLARLVRTTRFVSPVRAAVLTSVGE